MKKYYLDIYGNTASITTTRDGARLVCKNCIGDTWKDHRYKTERGARIALGKTGPGWKENAYAKKLEEERRKSQ